jgi:hypothetical protein
MKPTVSNRRSADFPGFPVYEIHKEQPNLVIDAIREVVNTLRTGTRQVTL